MDPCNVMLAYVDQKRPINNSVTNRGTPGSRIILAGERVRTSRRNRVNHWGGGGVFLSKICTFAFKFLKFAHFLAHLGGYPPPHPHPPPPPPAPHFDQWLERVSRLTAGLSRKSGHGLGPLMSIVINHARQPEYNRSYTILHHVL